jgi:hypothetical protein
MDGGAAELQYRSGGREGSGAAEWSSSSGRKTSRYTPGPSIPGMAEAEKCGVWSLLQQKLATTGSWRPPECKVSRGSRDRWGLGKPRDKAKHGDGRSSWKHYGNQSRHASERRQDCGGDNDGAS